MLINLQKRIKYNITSPLRLCTRARAGRSTSPAAPTASHPQGTGTHIRPGGPQEDPRIDMAGELMIMTGGGDHVCVGIFLCLIVPVTVGTLVRHINVFLLFIMNN